VTGGRRLFVAVWPSAELVDAIAALPRPEVPGLRWTTADQWHVTLRFLGGIADADVDAAFDAFARIDSVDPVTAVAGPSLGRFGHRVLHLPVHGLEGLATATVAATAAVGEPPDDRPFAGHLTLARAKGRGRPAIDLTPLAAAEVSATWDVHEVTLVHSTTAPGGSRYEVVARVPIGAGEGP
jgi:2'-5' RNA ligase